MDEFLCGTEMDMRNMENLRGFIQIGIINDDLLTRKRAMYILKRIVDSSYNDSKEWSKLNDFIMLCETLEEKQVNQFYS